MSVFLIRGIVSTPKFPLINPETHTALIAELVDSCDEFRHLLALELFRGIADAHHALAIETGHEVHPLADCLQERAFPIFGGPELAGDGHLRGDVVQEPLHEPVLLDGPRRIHQVDERAIGAIPDSTENFTAVFSGYAGGEAHHLGQ